jgi:methyl-accepting chemotaxis protein
MKRQKEIQKITEEALVLVGNTHQLVGGNLDISINAKEYTLLGDLAEDIDQISKAFHGYVDEISHILSHLSAGNMAVSFTEGIDFQGDFMPIKNALHKIRHSLNSSFEEINQLSNEVDLLCNQVESGASLIAENATEQAQLINNLTGTIYQITEQTANNAINAKAAADSMNEIQREAEIGSGYMNQMLSSIEKVQTSAQDISGIITIINGLAGQTKLLALNASIEAARAGDAGQGFSVVAKEVGILAQKSADAVRQTTQLIANSIDTAQESTQIANKTSGSFKSIRKSIDSATSLCTNIAEASNLQAQSLKDTSAIITDISGVVQNNAAYAQENCAGATNLAELSTNLKKVMTRFRLKNQTKDKTSEINDINRIDHGLLERLFDQLHKVTAPIDIDIVLEDIIKGQADFECLYVIDGHGYQISQTIMNPNIVIEQDDNFKPAMPGDYHGTKKYFRQAIQIPKEWYISYEYISTATGGLCKTLSYSYEGMDHKSYVMCIDLICRF